MKIIKLLSFLWLCFVCNTWAQNPTAQNPTDLPKILPPNPTAAAFARYGEIPVDISTGVPQIEIPLYTIKSRQLQVPLSLSYHASGNKVSDISTPVGLGWSLRGMGIVSRTILDRPDEEPNNQGVGGKAKYSSAQSYQDALSSLQPNFASYSALGAELYLDYTRKDKQADRFNYELPGKGGGTFRYDFNTDKLIIMPYKPVLISKSIDSKYTSGMIGSFGIVDETGTQYSFDKAYTTSQTSWNLLSYNCNLANTSWYLTKITSADGTDEIEYQYKDYTNDYKLGYYNHSTSWGIIEQKGLSGGVDWQGNFDTKLWLNPQRTKDVENVNYITTHEPLLDKIISSNTIVTFEYASDRVDWKDAKYRLSSIKIWDKLNNKLIKEIDLDNNQYFSGRLKLGGVNVKSTNAFAQTYTLEYDESVDLPPYNSWERISNGGEKYFSEDFWGYYNGANNAGLIPSEFLTCVPDNAYSCRSDYGGSRRPNYNYAKAGLIKEIQYPTGGKINFEFEPNYGCLDIAGNEQNVGGFRIKTISSLEKTKTFKYLSGRIPYSINKDLFTFSQQYDWDWNPCEWGTQGGLPLGYPNDNYAYRLTTQSSSFCPLTFTNGAPVVYTKVIEYDGTESSNNGKVEYNYAVPDDPKPEAWMHIYGTYWRDNGSYAPQLLSKTIYKNSNGTYMPISFTQNSYNVFRDTEYSTGVNVLKTSYDIDDAGAYTENGYWFQQSCPTSTPSYVRHFSYVDQKANEKVSLLTQSDETTYTSDGKDSQISTTNYKYNLTNLQPIDQTTVSSQGDVIRTEFKYPCDFLDNISENNYYVYAGMVNLNMLTPVIEKKSYKGTQFLQSVRTNYDVWGNNIIAPKTVVNQIGTNNPEVRLRYNGYDNKGNVSNISKENDIKYAYLWGYSQTYPIAQAINADTKDIFYTSFEEGDGNSSDGDSKTGRKSSTGTSIALSNLTNGKYTLSYWRKSGNVWTLQKSTEIVTGGIFQRNIPGQIDEVRFYPESSQMVTYTYDPLVGVTSMCDANNIITYYEYDGFGRLSIIRDKDRNILKKIGYSLDEKPEEQIPGAYYNVEKYSFFTKNNCEIGYTGGSPVAYRVSPWKYYSMVSQAAADQLAQDDINANGQAYANQNGNCVPAYTNTVQSGNFIKNDCNNGDVGTSVTYTVPTGKYRATSQSAADQLAVNDVNANGQSYANNYGRCYNSSLPYLKLTFDNYHTDGINYYYDVVVRSYQDAACTIPKSANFTVNIKKEVFSTNAGSSVFNIESITGSGTSYVLYPNILYLGYENGDYIERYFNLEPGEYNRAGY